MKNNLGSIVRIILLVLIWVLWVWMFTRTFSSLTNLFIILGGTLLVIPIAWSGRRLLDRQPTLDRSMWTTTYVHYGVGGLLGAALIRAILTHQNWVGWQLPIPPSIGLVLTIVTGAATLLTVVNLALKGLGAPFVIALSRKLAADWMYAWTRNPMVFTGLAFLVSLGIWYQSLFFVLWALALVAPAMLFFVKIYEERELEVRFGASYLEYKARTPFLFPSKPKG